MRQFILITSITCVIGGILYAIGDILLPFILALAIAYIVSPIADYLDNKCHMKRWLIALLLVLCIMSLFMLLWIALAPIIYDQIINFIKSIPKYHHYLKEHVLPLAKAQLDKVDHAFVKNIPQFLDKVLSLLFKDMVAITNKILKSWTVMVDILLGVILIPIFTFYFIKDWRVIGGTIKDLLPIKQRHSYDKLLAVTDNALSSMIRSQVAACLVLAVYYSIALSILQVDYSVFIGITTGLLSFIPFVAVLGGFLASAISIYFEFQNTSSLIAVTIVFFIGSAIEHILSAVLMGNKTGLHPILIIFFILVGGNLFGFTGVVLAVPIGAILMVLVKFMTATRDVKTYKNKLPK